MLHCWICGTVEWDVNDKLDYYDWICDPVEYVGVDWDMNVK